MKNKYIKLFEEVANELDRTIELSTDLVPLFNINFYTDGDFDILSEYFNDNFKSEVHDGEIFANEDDYYTLWDSKIFSNRVLEEFKLREDEFTKIFKSKFNSIERIKIESINHPREYNFKTDSLNFDIIVSDMDSFQHEVLSDLKSVEDIDQVLYNKFKSYSGFTSFMPQSFDEVKKDIEGEDIERGFGAALTVILEHDDMLEEFEYIKGDVIESIGGNSSWSDFISDGIEIIDIDTYKMDIEKMYADEKSIEEITEFIFDDLEERDIFVEKDLVEKKVKQFFTEKGKTTGDLFK